MRATRGVILPFLLCGLMVAVCHAQTTAPSCKSLGPHVYQLQDFIRRPISGDIHPTLPSGLDPAHLPLTVKLRIVVDREGEVKSVCVLSPKSPSRSVRKLVETATAAVLSWKYEKDFGLKGELHLVRQLARGEVVFRFVPPRLLRPSSVTPSQTGIPLPVRLLWNGR